MTDFKFIEWVDNGILVAVSHKFLYNPDRIIWFADISRIGMNGRIIHEIDWKDSWSEAYEDAELKVKKLKWI